MVAPNSKGMGQDTTDSTTIEFLVGAVALMFVFGLMWTPVSGATKREKKAKKGEKVWYRGAYRSREYVEDRKLLDE